MLTPVVALSPTTKSLLMLPIIIMITTSLSDEPLHTRVSRSSPIFTKVLDLLPMLTNPHILGTPSASEHAREHVMTSHAQELSLYAPTHMVSRLRSVTNPLRGYKTS